MATTESVMVDAAPVIEHVRSLKRKGMPLTAISRAAGVQVNKFYLGYYHDENGGRIEVVRCRQSTRERVLAVEHELWVEPGFSGELVRRARLTSGTSLAALARLTGMDVQTVRRWERGDNLPRHRSQIEKVAQAVGVPYEAFFAPVVPGGGDAYTEEFRPPPTGQDDYIMSGYPCGVCGKDFRSRIRLATHTHARKGRT